MLSVKKARKDFPILNEKIGGKPIIYFDNACQSLRPQAVIDAVEEYYREYPVCEGRSIHRLGEKVTAKCHNARKVVAKFIGAKREEEIVFTRNTTEGINLVARSLRLNPGDAILLSDKEHNSNLVPWQIKAKREKLSLIINRSDENNGFDLENFRQNMSEKVKLVAVGITSNLDGMSAPIEEIIEIAHSYGAKVLLDGAQALSHREINVAKLGVDFLAFSGHKMLGPSGIGVLYGKYDLLSELDSFLTGGDTVEYTTYDEYELLPPPKKFEAGLQDYAGIIGLAEAIKYLQRIGFKKIIKQERKLNRYITEELLKIPKLQIIGDKNADKRGGIISFYIESKDSHRIALMLNSSANIMVRSGQFCVHSWFRDRQIKNAVRVSLSFHNTMEEAEIFVKNLKEIIKII